VKSSRLSIWYDKIEFIIRNQVNDMALMHGICHVSKGEREGDFNTTILPKESASVKVRASHLLAGCIECCLVYELIDQRNESKPIMEDYHVFIAVEVSTIPFIKYKASSVIFRSRKRDFTGSENNIKELKDSLLRDNSVNYIYSYACAIRNRTLRLYAVLDPGRHTCIEVTLGETAELNFNQPPIL
jgi:hypothetical protein